MLSRGGALCGLGLGIGVVGPIAYALSLPRPAYVPVEIFGFIGIVLLVLGCVLAFVGAIVRTAGREKLPAKEHPPVDGGRGRRGLLSSRP